MDGYLAAVLDLYFVHRGGKKEIFLFLVCVGVLPLKDLV